MHLEGFLLAEPVYSDSEPEISPLGRICRNKLVDRLPAAPIRSDKKSATFGPDTPAVPLVRVERSGTVT